MLDQAIDLPFDLTQPAGQFLAIVFFLVPGLNCTWTIERLAGRATLSSTERLLRAVGWSVLIDASASPWLVHVGRRIVAGMAPPAWELIVGASVMVFVAPLALALLMVLLRRDPRTRALMQRVTRIHAEPMPWDFAFSQGTGLRQDRASRWTPHRWLLRRSVVRFWLPGAGRPLHRGSLGPVCGRLIRSDGPRFVGDAHQPR